MRLRLALVLCACAAPLYLATTASALPSVPSGPARTAVFPLQGVDSAALSSQIAAGATVPTWSGTIASLGTAYPYKMVGRSPLVHEVTPVTTVNTVVIPIRITFTDSGHVFDPTARDATCLPTSTATALSLVQASPIFQTHAYAPGGTSVGTVQYTDAFQRENFAKYTVSPGAINPGYGVNLKLINHGVISLTVSPSAGVTLTGSCGDLGYMNINTWDSYVRGTCFRR